VCEPVAESWKYFPVRDGSREVILRNLGTDAEIPKDPRQDEPSNAQSSLQISSSSTFR